jgi:hypothetical protein
MFPCLTTIRGWIKFPIGEGGMASMRLDEALPTSRITILVHKQTCCVACVCLCVLVRACVCERMCCAVVLCVPACTRRCVCARVDSAPFVFSCHVHTVHTQYTHITRTRAYEHSKHMPPHHQKHTTPHHNAAHTTHTYTTPLPRYVKSMVTRARSNTHPR